MGRGSYDAGTWASYSATTAAKPVHAIFTKSVMDKDLDPKNIKLRESRDSDANPLSTPIAVFLDVTGSMGSLAQNIAQKGLGKIMEEIIARKPVTDPHLLFGAIGDANCDRAPLQASQFEVEVEPMTTQLEKIFVEGGGGGNSFESYDLAWIFAAMRTETDSFQKRGKKGYLFTVGDEPPSPRLIAAQVEAVFGEKLIESDLDLKSAVALVEREWNVFHIMCAQGSHMRYSRDDTVRKWRDVLGQRAIILDDSNDLAEVIVSTIEVIEGRDADAVAKSWSGSTAVTVANAVRGLTKTNDIGSDIVAL